MPLFKPRVRKHKVLRREKRHEPVEVVVDSNTVEILPKHQMERQAKLKALKDELRAQQPKMSGKKQKRLDKYIETKLKREENLEFLKKLASTKIDTSLLQSSKDLGVAKYSRKAIALDTLMKRRAGIVRKDEHENSDSGSDSEPRPVFSQRKEVEVIAPPSSTPVSEPQIGGGLKRPLERDSSGNPIVRKRQRMNARHAVEPSSEESSEDEESWDGLSEGSESGSDSDSERDSENDLEESGSDAEQPILSGLFSRARNVEDRGSAYIPPPPSKESRPEQVRRDFKEWAEQQMNEARDFQPSRPIDHTTHGKTTMIIAQRPMEMDPLPQELEIPQRVVDRKTFSVAIERPASLQEARLKLPIVAEEQKIMEAIHNHPTVIVCGATGSGKTTQVPQFLYESGYGALDGPTPGLIGITQPRRVAAVTMAKRVGDEMGPAGKKVSYQIRYESTTDRNTAIKYMTDGILIREIAKDFSLSKYSAIIIDEAHERSVNTDILIGMVSRIVDLRLDMNMKNPEVKPLKLIIMSATLMIESFTSNPTLFPRAIPPVVESEGRQYPVTMHFSKRTQRNYMEEAFSKVCKGHKKLPPGAILVFLTGQNEITTLAKQLREALGSGSSTAYAPKAHIRAVDVPLETEDNELGKETMLDDFSSEDGSEGSEHDHDEEFDIGDEESASGGVLVLPLYSQLPTKEQLRVFEPPPENTRMIIVATNVAETSITIPGIRYVFDCGRSKEKTFDRTTGVQSFEIGWISKASASQRAGRAGRTGPGHCYRLYSSAVYERDFVEHAEPEILRMPAEGVVLQLKSMDLQHVVNFPFPTPPDRQSIAKAEKLLSYLGALNSSGLITTLGRELSLYPLSPRYSKMLAIGNQHGCMYLTIALVAALVIPDIFIPRNQLDLSTTVQEGEHYSNLDRLADDERDQRKREYNKSHLFLSGLDKYSDAMKLLSAFCAHGWAVKSDDAESFCAKMFLRPKALKEAFQLFQQLMQIVSANKPGTIDPSKTTLPRATEKQVRALKQITATGFIDQIAIRADLAPNTPSFEYKPRRAIDVPYLTLFASHTGRAQNMEEMAVYIHPSSVLAHTPVKELPQYLVFSHLQRSSTATVNGTKVPKVRMHALTDLTGAQIVALAKDTPLLEYSKPVGKVEAAEGKANERVCWVVPSLVGEKGKAGWPLPAQKVLQKRDAKGDWVIVKNVS